MSVTTNRATKMSVSAIAGFSANTRSAARKRAVGGATCGDADPGEVRGVPVAPDGVDREPRPRPAQRKPDQREPEEEDHEPRRDPLRPPMPGAELEVR